MLNINSHLHQLHITPTENSIQALESALSSYMDYKHIILLDSVHSAFVLALSTVAKESHVLCSPNAPIDLYSALRSNLCTTQYADLKLDGTMETRFYKKTFTSNTKALILSHNHGVLSDCAATLQFTQEHNLSFIEDATQAFSQREKSGADLVVYALDTLIPESIAKGAFIATDSDAIAQTLQTRVGGGYVHKKFWNYDLLSEEIDHNLSSLIAQLALDTLQTHQEKEQRITAIQNFYHDKLSNNRLIELPQQSQLTPHTLFQVMLVPALFCPKEDIYKALTDAGIDVKVGHKPIYKTTAYKDETLSLFGAEEVFKAQLLLPCHHLMTDEDIAYVVETLEKVLETYGYRGCSF